MIYLNFNKNLEKKKESNPDAQEAKASNKLLQKALKRGSEDK